jgi:hypothetical protein
MIIAAMQQSPTVDNNQRVWLRECFSSADVIFAEQRYFEIPQPVFPQYERQAEPCHYTKTVDLHILARLDRGEAQSVSSFLRFSSPDSGDSTFAAFAIQPAVDLRLVPPSRTTTSLQCGGAGDS